MGLKSALAEAADGVTLPVTCFGVHTASQLAPSFIIAPAFCDKFTNSALNSQHRGPVFLLYLTVMRRPPTHTSRAHRQKRTFHFNFCKWVITRSFNACLHSKFPKPTIIIKQSRIEGHRFPWLNINHPHASQALTG